MFERYTEQARRLVFFARYEASQNCSSSIDTEHLLLGLLREGGGIVGPILKQAGVSVSAIRKEVESRAVAGRPVSTSIDIPLTAPAKSVLQYAMEETERLGAEHLGTEHILLGLLREPDTTAGEILRSHGLFLESVREDVRLSSGSRAPAPGPSSPFDKIVGFLKQLEERQARYHVSFFRGNALRVEIVLAEERWAVTFFGDGRVTADVFWLSSGAQGEGSLAGLLERLGSKPPAE